MVKIAPNSNILNVSKTARTMEKENEPSAKKPRFVGDRSKLIGKRLWLIRHHIKQPTKCWLSVIDYCR